MKNSLRIQNGPLNFVVVVVDFDSVCLSDMDSIVAALKDFYAHTFRARDHILTRIFFEWKKMVTWVWTPGLLPKFGWRCFLWMPKISQLTLILWTVRMFSYGIKCIAPLILRLSNSNRALRVKRWFEDSWALGKNSDAFNCDNVRNNNKYPYKNRLQVHPMVFFSSKFVN